MGEYKVDPLLYCKYCAKSGHIIDNCPDRKSLKVDVARVKKEWVKPEIRKYHVVKAVSLTETREEMVDRLKPRCVSLTGFDRKAYQREYMRKKRGM